MNDTLGQGELGDYIVPKFNALGKRISEPSFVGSAEEIKEKSLAIIKSALLGSREGKFVRKTGIDVGPQRRSESAINPSKNPTKKQRKVNNNQEKSTSSKLPIIELDKKPLKVKPSSIYLPIEEAMRAINMDEETNYSVNTPSISATKSIYVTLSSNFGKIKVSVAAVLEEETALILVYNNEEAMSFIPHQGDILSIIINKDRTERVMYTGFLFTWIDNTKKLMVFVKAPAEE